MTSYPAKYVDVDNNVPRISLLQSLTNYHNSIHEYKIMEMVICHHHIIDS